MKKKIKVWSVAAGGYRDVETVVFSSYMEAYKYMESMYEDVASDYEKNTDNVYCSRHEAEVYDEDMTCDEAWSAKIEEHEVEIDTVTNAVKDTKRQESDDPKFVVKELLSDAWTAAVEAERAKNRVIGYIDDVVAETLGLPTKTTDKAFQQVIAYLGVTSCSDVVIALNEIDREAIMETLFGEETKEED